jgi:hypothetical protein
MLPPLPEEAAEPLLPAPGTLTALPELEPVPEPPLLLWAVVPPLDELPPLPLEEVAAGFGLGLGELLPQPAMARARAGTPKWE